MTVDSELLLVSIARLSRWASRLSQLGVPVATARLVSLIEELQPARVSDLAQADQTSQPTMTTHVQRLEQAGLVRREPDADRSSAAGGQTLWRNGGLTWANAGEG